jgi:hypothetical protein
MPVSDAAFSAGKPTTTKTINLSDRGGYNRQRLNSAIGYIAPDEAERQAA